MGRILTLVFSTLCIIILYSEIGSVFSTRVFLTSIMIQVFSIHYIFSRANNPFSLNKIVYLFSVFFFGIAPLLQFYQQKTLFGARPLKEQEYFYMNVLILVILIVYQIMYNYYFKRKISTKLVLFVNRLQVERSLSFSQHFSLILISSVSFFVMFYANNFNITSMLIRGGELKQSTIENSSFYLIASQFFRPMSMMCLLLYIATPRKNKLVLFFLFFNALLTCFPLGMARFSVAAMYIPLLLLLVPALKKRYVFSISFVLALLIFFPFLDNFRSFSNSSEMSFGFNFGMFTDGHFDSYQNFALIVSENIITWGSQLLGVFFFWVPRAVWPSKPIGSGAFLAEKMDFYFDNISANFFAEGYINFGMFGIIIFVFFLAYISAKLDKLHWNFTTFEKRNLYNIVYFVLLGMFFLMLRGDLLSSFAFIIGNVLSSIIVFRLVSQYKKNKVRNRYY